MVNVVQKTDFLSQPFRFIAIQSVNASAFHTVVATGTIFLPVHDTELADGSYARWRRLDVYVELSGHG
jgi:hypothetical protein